VHIALFSGEPPLNSASEKAAAKVFLTPETSTVGFLTPQAGVDALSRPFRLQSEDAGRGAERTGSHALSSSR
jgi:hypothetical protein